ncbi:hypothetical protein [Streptomyces peucetius]|uniref:hypothetical protein n=1 Tax=Streptomyces peucetius TaxID=1950 RepID=UPI0039AEF79B
MLSVAACSTAAIAGTLAVAGGGEPPGNAPGRPLRIDGGSWQSGHLQGMALDRKGFMYFSFTNLLVKTDLEGRPVGSVTGFAGHLGDLDFNTDDRRVYGSLEYKEEKAFYIAILDGDRINRMDMDAATSGVVSTVHLQEVVDDYTADMDGDGAFDGNTARTADHRYGCSGIDGLAFGPAFGKKGGQQKLTVAYGVYPHTGRTDNDHQVLLQYDIRDWSALQRPLTESQPHRSGPSEPDGKYFVYTGNTTYGVQNLEYDAHSRRWLMATYKGTKTTFPDSSLFVVDGDRVPEPGPLRGQPEPEQGQLLDLLPQGVHHARSDTYGWDSPGQFGLVALDDGQFYVGEAAKDHDGRVTRQTGQAVLHRWTGTEPTPFTAVAAPPA